MRYEDIDALNYSYLKLLEVSPAYAKHMWDHPEERGDTPAFKRGRLIHCACLEPEEIDKRYIVPPIFENCAILPDGTILPQPYFGDLRFKGPKTDRNQWLLSLPDGSKAMSAKEFEREWYENLEDVEVISGDDRRLAMRCRESLYNNPYIDHIMTGADTEKVIEVTMGGVKCKMRLDFITNRVGDLKTTRKLTRDECEREAVRFNYHVQIAWYHDGAVEAGLIKGDVPPVIIFICIDPNSTFIDIIPFEIHEGVLAAGRARYQRLLAQYKGFRKMDYWPGDGEKMHILDLPDWKMKEDFGE